MPKAPSQQAICHAGRIKRAKNEQKFRFCEKFHRQRFKAAPKTSIFEVNYIRNTRQTID